MSAIGWGVLVGGIVGSTFYVPKLVRPDRVAGWLVTGFGASLGGGVILGFIPVPYGYGAIAFLCLAAGLPFLPFVFVRAAMEAKAKGDAGEAARRAEAARVSADHRAWLEKEKAAHFDAMREVWPAQNECSYKGRPGIFAMRSDSAAITVMPYEIGSIFEASPPIEIPLADIFSVSVTWRDVEERFYRTELVPVSSTKKRSSVGRAVVGGLAFGPAGAIVGAVSGLGGKTTIQNEERKIADVRMVKADPSLSIGTTIPNLAKLEIRFRTDSVPEHWLNEIRAAQARSGQPLTT